MSGKVEIKETGIVNGSIKTDSLIINEGGIFSGDVKRMTDGSEKKDYQLEPKEDGAKNSALKLMTASILADSKTTISNVPMIEDVRTMVEVL